MEIIRLPPSGYPLSLRFASLLLTPSLPLMSPFGFLFQVSAFSFQVSAFLSLTPLLPLMYQLIRAVPGFSPSGATLGCSPEQRPTLPGCPAGCPPDSLPSGFPRPRVQLSRFSFLRATRPVLLVEGSKKLCYVFQE